ncbi:NHLP leader peptide family RiPP precursor [Rhodocaloribacter sp.]|jgi:hypothetical protein
MNESYLDQRQKLNRQVTQKAMEDANFRQRLLEDPKGTLETEYGISIPNEADIKVFQETPQSHYFVLPPRPIQDGDELTEDELEAVAGGWYVNLLWSSICFGSGEGGPDNADISVSAS